MSDPRWAPLEEVDRPQQRGRGNAKPAPVVFGPTTRLSSNEGVIDPGAWIEKPVPSREWIARNYLPAREVSLISGQGGVGKSILGMQLVIAGGTGTDWLGMKVRQCRAIGVYCEDRGTQDDGAELHIRCNGILKAAGLGYDALSEHVMFIGRKSKDSEIFSAGQYDAKGEWTHFYQRLRATVLDFGAQILVLDSLYNFFGGNENNRTQVNQFCNGLSELADEIGGAVAVIAHPSKDGMATGSGFSGSTAWHDAVRSRLYLHRKKHPSGDPEKKGPLILQHMKGNYGPEQEAIELVYENGRFVTVSAADGRKPFVWTPGDDVDERWEREP